MTQLFTAYKQACNKISITLAYNSIIKGDSYWLLPPFIFLLENEIIHKMHEIHNYNLDDLDSMDLERPVFNAPAIIIANHIISQAHHYKLSLSSMKLQAIMLLLEGATQAKFSASLCNYKHYYVYSITCYLPEIYLAYKNTPNDLHIKSYLHADETGKLISEPYPKLNAKMLDSELLNQKDLIKFEIDRIILNLLKNRHIIDQIIKPDIQKLPPANTSLISQMPEYDPGHIAYLFIKNKDRI